MFYRSILIVLLVFFSSCSSAQVENKKYELMLDGLLSHSVTETSVDELSKRKENIILLDARESNEYEVSHLDGAIHIGYDEFDLSSVSHINKDAEIIVYCSVGYRSEKIAERLVENGYTNVQNLYGGIFEWMNRGQEVINTQGVTDSIHAFDRIWGVWLDKGIKVYD